MESIKPGYDLSGAKSGKACIFCSKPIQVHLNYCDWTCHIEHAKKLGGKVHSPNGLPIRCIKHDGGMYEHEHGDHQDYKFPVDLIYVGPEEERDSWIDGDGKIVPMTDAEKEMMGHQEHALIYTDGCIALTLYEYSYAICHLRDGMVLKGSIWERNQWKLTDESREKILKFSVESSSDKSDAPQR